MDVSKNSGIPKSSILIGFSIINHPFWGFPPIFWKHPDVGELGGTIPKVPRQRRAWQKRLLSYHHLRVSYHLLWDQTSEVWEPVGWWLGTGWIRRFK